MTLMEVLGPHKGYGLSQYNICTSDEIMIRVRLEECERNIIFIHSEVRQDIFLIK